MRQSLMTGSSWNVIWVDMKIVSPRRRTRACNQQVDMRAPRRRGPRLGCASHPGQAALPGSRHRTQTASDRRGDSISLPGPGPIFISLGEAQPHAGCYEKDPTAGWVNRPQLEPEKQYAPFTRPATLEEE